MLVVDNAHKFNEDDSDVYEKVAEPRGIGGGEGGWLDSEHCTPIQHYIHAWTDHQPSTALLTDRWTGGVFLSSQATKLRDFIRKEMESVLEVEQMIASSPHNTGPPHCSKARCSLAGRNADALISLIPCPPCSHQEPGHQGAVSSAPPAQEARRAGEETRRGRRSQERQQEAEEGGWRGGRRGRTGR